MGFKNIKNTIQEPDKVNNKPLLDWSSLSYDEKNEIILKNFPFPKIRDIQLETIKIILDKFIDEDIKDVIMELPTGSGKSAISKTVANIMAKMSTQSTFLTSSKTLQEQYVNDFEDLVNISNSIDYPCILTTAAGEVRDYHYNDDNCKKYSAKFCRDKCPYKLQTDEWRDAEQRVTNYHFYGFFNPKRVKKTYDNKLLIMDEVHNLPEITTSIAEITIKVFVLNSLKSMLNKGLTSIKIFAGKDIELDEDTISDIQDFFEYLFQIKNKDNLIHLDKDAVKEFKYLQSYINKLNKEVREETSKLLAKDIQLPMEMHSMNDILDKLTFYFNILTFGGIFYISKDYKENEIHIKPFDAKAAKILYFKKANYRLYLSATIGNIRTFTEELGIKDYFYKSYESIFHKNNRPIYYMPICNFTYKNRDEAIKQIGNFLNQLLPEYKNDRGVIFVSSYRDAEDILSKLDSENKKRCIIPKNTLEVRNLIKLKDYDVIISPIMFEGADLKDDKARFAVLCKIPYLSLGDDYVKTKLKYNKEWYEHNTLLKVVQSYGRGVRHEEDKCDFFIVDSNFSKLETKLPMWIREAIEK